SQKTSEKKLIQSVWQRCSCRESVYGIPTQRDCYRHTLSALVISLAVTGANLVKLPVHSGGGLVIHLHPVEAHVAGPAFWIACVHVGQRDETAAIFRPAFKYRQIVEGKVVSIFEAMHDFLAWGITH